MLNLRVAHAYDRNRYHPPEVSGRIATCITEPVERSFRDPHLLEVGVGTGRISMPIVARGYKLTGLDSDPEMMELFRAKYSGVSRKVSLEHGDAQELPFAESSFHGVIAVHVWHLVPDLARALSEAVRVIHAGGYLFEGWDASTGDGAELEIQNRWCEVLKDLGGHIQRGGHTAALNASREHLKALGFESEETIIAQWEVTRTPLEVVEALNEGLISFARNVPADLRYRTSRELMPWLRAQYPDLETPICSNRAFYLRTTRIAK